MMRNETPRRNRRVMIVLTAVATVAAALNPLPAHVPSAAASVAGKIVFLDPGHAGVNNSGNSRQVPNGRGGAKDCQTSGTETAGGYSEASFAFDTTLRIRAALTELGVRSAMSRGDNTSTGPCIDQRAYAANALAPDLIVSIHADGGPPAGSGFHVSYSSPPLNDAQAASAVAARVIRDGLVDNGMRPATYIGKGGLYGRADLAGLNLSEYPAVLIELGNMRNPGEGARMSSEKGRQWYADAVVAAVTAYLKTVPDRL